MVPCANCRHGNVNGFTVCSRCGCPASEAPRVPAPVMRSGTAGASGLPVVSGLLAGSAGGGAGGAGGLDEYQRLMAERAAKQKRNRIIFAVIAIAAIGAGATVMVMNSKKAKAAQEVLEAGGRFAVRDKTETGSFWNCITSSEVDVGSFKGVDEIQMRIESAYFTQQKTFSDHLTTQR